MEARSAADKQGDGGLLGEERCRHGSVAYGSAMNDESTQRERRRHERFACDGFAEVVSFPPELLFRGAVKDISLTGCYVETRARLNLKRNAEIEVRFTAHGEQLSSLARVKEVRPGKGVGIEFVPGDPMMSARFQRLIEDLAARLHRAADESS